AHVEVAVLASGEEAISATPVTQGVGRPFKKQKVLNPQQGSQARTTLSVSDLGSGESKQRGIICYRCGLLGHKVSVCPQKKGAGLAVQPVVVPPGSSNQPDFGPIKCSVGRQLLGSSSAQILNQSRAQAPPTCWVCNQAGHIRRFCTQSGASLGVLRPSQAQFHSTGQEQYRFGELASQTARASVESSSQAPIGEVCSCSRCGQKGHISSSCPWLVSS
ncbi:cold shock protein 1-like, partial [Camellia sinensis]|uniref:cold shock protein 1-like n=1 Tax=Camellia sinensis TaxID=4442 RepID=UPI00103569CB